LNLLIGIFFGFLFSSVFLISNIYLSPLDQEEVYELPFRLEGMYDNLPYIGLSFNQSWNPILDSLGLLHIKDNNQTKNNFFSEPIYVAAFSSNHFHESIQFLKDLSNTIKPKTLYIYDIGLNETERHIIILQFAEMIAEFRKFAFERYPPYVSILFSYRWKPLIIAEMLSLHPAIFWMDTSTRIKAPLNYNFLRNCSSESVPSSTCDYFPWIMTDASGHSMFANTFREIYQYLPIPDKVAKVKSMWGANVMLVFSTRETKEKVLRIWVLCALEFECMAPSGSMKANHRFDQSAINIILALVNNYNETRYTHHFDKAIRAERELYHVF